MDLDFRHSRCPGLPFTGIEMTERKMIISGAVVLMIGTIGTQVGGDIGVTPLAGVKVRVQCDQEKR